MKKIKKNFKKEYVGLILHVDNFKKILSLLIDNNFEYKIEHENTVIDEDEDFLELFEDDSITNIELTANLKPIHDSIYLTINSDSSRLTSYNLSNEKIYTIIHKIDDILENKQNKIYLIFKEPYNYIIYLIILVLFLIILNMLVKNVKIYYLTNLLIIIIVPLITYQLNKNLIKNRIVKEGYNSYFKKSIDFFKNNIGGILTGILITVIGELIVHFII